MANPLANVPVSKILKNKSTFEDEPKRKSREDWRKAKELEEARKAGTAPAAVDEEGKDINPHIPQYISATPWYFGSQGPTLKHQRPQPEKQRQFSGIHEFYKRGVDESKKFIKWRKGSCENCGAMGHNKKECFERPRNVGAKYTNTNIASDDFKQPSLSFDYDGKRDRWAGYDPSEHRTIVEEYQKVEEAKRQLRAEKLNAEGDDEDKDSDTDEDKYVDEVDMPGTKVDSKQRITVRNLRIREDTAKYLRNLDPDSAYYDPKTRSMRDDPYAGKDQEVDYQGENFARFSGDTRQHATAQLFAWEAHERGVDVHLLAEPTKLELLKKEYDKKRDELKVSARDSVIEEYGGGEHLRVPETAAFLAQTEHYVEYSRYGKIIKGQDRQIIKSKYEEDVLTNNHSKVWGSYWSCNRWAYKCCHSYVKNSYCTGEAGKNSAPPPITVEEVEEELDVAVKIEEPTSDEERSKTERKLDKSKKKEKKKRQKEKKRNLLKLALEKEEMNKKEMEELLTVNERKRPYNSMYEVKELTNEEIEAYQMKRQRDDDPMAQFLN